MRYFFKQKAPKQKKLSDVLQQVDAPENNWYRPQRIFEPQTLTERFRAMSPYDFEFFIKDIFEANWYTTIRDPLYKTTRNGKKMPIADGWIDYICEKNWQNVFVQVKTYKWRRQVTLPQIREFNWALQDVGRRESDKAYFITTTTFTKEAEKYAKKHDIVHVDYDSFVYLYNWTANKNDTIKDRLEQRLLAINYTTNQKFTQHMRTCPWCGAPVVRKKSPFSNRGFRWCQNFSKTGCKYVAAYKEEKELVKR